MLDPVKCFKILNIRLGASNFTSVSDVAETVINNERCTVQSRRWVTHEFIDRETQTGTISLLAATVHLGVRLLEAKIDESAGSKPKALYTIEANFIAEFEVIADDFNETSLRKFLDSNAAHIAWPFWRHHVFVVLQTACLPVIQVPLLAGVRKLENEQGSLKNDS